MISVKEAFEKNRKSPELQAWVSLYHYLFNDNSKKIKLWREFQKDLPAKAVLREQKRFINDFNEPNFLKLYRPAMKKDLVLVKFHRSLAIAYCRGEKYISVDFID